MSDQKSCINCKEPIDIKAKFCPNCGTEQPENKAIVPEVIEEKAEEQETEGDVTAEHSEENNQNEQNENN